MKYAATFLFIFLLTTISSHAELTADPVKAGLTPEGVATLDKTLSTFANRGLVAGGVAVIERNGTIGYARAFGKQSLESGAPMAMDTIFRIYSMTKAVTSVATMILVDEGRIALDDPIANYLPELSDLKVGVESKDAATGAKTLELVPADHQPTILELLSHTAGFGYGLAPSSQVDVLYQQAELLKNDETLAEKIRKLGQLPLKHQPGSQWDYSISVDVLGRLVEVVSGQTLDVFFQERIFAPLGMVDTGFHVPEEKRARFADMYALSIFGQLTPSTEDLGRKFLEPPAMLMAGGGLVSTAGDYLSFCRMLLNKGVAGDTRILKEETVTQMTTDVLGDRPISLIGRALGMTGAGFGLGFSVTKEPFRESRGAMGEYNWGGAASTLFWVDPEKQMIGIYLIQILPSNFTTPLQFKKTAYNALAE